MHDCMYESVYDLFSEELISSKNKSNSHSYYRDNSKSYCGDCPAIYFDSFTNNYEKIEFAV